MILRVLSHSNLAEDQAREGLVLKRFMGVNFV